VVLGNKIGVEVKVVMAKR